MRRMLGVVLCGALFLAGCAGRETAPEPPVGAEAPAPSPEGTEALFDALLALRERGERAGPGERARAYGEAVEKDPGYAEGWAMRGLAHGELGRTEEAFEDLTRAVRLAPSADHYAFRALVSLRAGEAAAARRDLDYALTKDQKRPLVWNLRGALALREGRLADACKAFATGCARGDCAFLQTAREAGQCK